MIVIATFYKFAPLPDYVDLRLRYKRLMQRLELKGTILLATEGVNATISGSRAGIDEMLAELRKDPRLADMPHKESFNEVQPFQRAKVRLKKETISMGIPANPAERVGTYVKPKDWNALIANPDVVLIDSRNQYETEIGKFKGAVEPGIRNFKELPAFTTANFDPAKTPKVATYCTGGIRCEKYTSYLLSLGFKEVYHLEGGILKYLEEIPAEQSTWEGECFVFDERVAVGHGLVAKEAP